MNKTTLFTLFFLLMTTSGILYADTGNSWISDMFSFFGIKNKSVPTTVHNAVAAELVEIKNFPVPVNDHLANNLMTCKQVEVLGNPPSSLKVETGYVETYEKGFVLQSPNKSLALLNDPQKPRFDVWTLDEENPLIPRKRISTSELIPESKNWMMFRVINVACLSPQTALVAITYDNPRPEVRLYAYNLFDNKFNLLADAESHGQDSSKYYDHKVLNEKESLVIYYSDTKRQSSEIYHNYYNHILLFSEQYPQGLEIVKLGIDIGNIVDWHVTDKTLFLHTRDNRGKGTAKVNYWSLDLSKLITK